MKTNFSAKDSDKAAPADLRTGRAGWNRRLILATLLVIAATGFSGCGGGYYTSGYGPSYYAPDYGPYYGDYDYNGAPYWGAGPYLGGGIVVSGVHHHRYYGGHHFTHQSFGPRSRGPSISRGPAPSSIRGGGQRR